MAVLYTHFRNLVGLVQAAGYFCEMIENPSSGHQLELIPALSEHVMRDASSQQFVWLPVKVSFKSPEPKLHSGYIANRVVPHAVLCADTTKGGNGLETVSCPFCREISIKSTTSAVAKVPRFYCLLIAFLLCMLLSAAEPPTGLL